MNTLPNGVILAARHSKTKKFFICFAMRSPCTNFALEWLSATPIIAYMFRKKTRNWYVPKGQEPTDFDKRILSFQNKGELVPTRKLIKTPEQIEGIKRSGEVNTGVLDLIEKEIHAGMSTADIDKLVYDFTVAHGAIPAPLNYVCVRVLTRWCATAFLLNMKFLRKATLLMWT